MLGGFAAAVVALPLSGIGPPLVVHAADGARRHARPARVWIGARRLRCATTAASTRRSPALLLTYIAIAIMNFFVEGAAARSGLGQQALDRADRRRPTWSATIPGTDVHWGLVVGHRARASLLWVLIDRTTFGFAARVTGGNVARRAGAGPAGRHADRRLLRASPAPAPASPAIFEVAAIHGKANASLVAGYGFTGILVAFLARHNPLAIVPVAILFGGIAAAGGLIQRRMGLPDATVLVLQGLDLRRAAGQRDALRPLQASSSRARALGAT